MSEANEQRSGSPMQRVVPGSTDEPTMNGDVPGIAQSCQSCEHFSPGHNRLGWCIVFRENEWDTGGSDCGSWQAKDTASQKDG